VRRNDVGVPPVIGVWVLSFGFAFSLAAHRNSKLKTQNPKLKTQNFLPGAVRSDR
jgi:hypothetical protein